jgi:hypothetical protein
MLCLFISGCVHSPEKLIEYPPVCVAIDTKDLFISKSVDGATASSRRIKDPKKYPTLDLTEWELVKGRKKGNFGAFIGFAPVKDPKIEVYVDIHDPQTDKKGGAHGGENAAPVFKRIVEDVLAQMKIAPDKDKN